MISGPRGSDDSSSSFSKWSRISDHILKRTKKEILISQMLEEHGKREFEENLLLEDFALGVELKKRHMYHHIEEENGEFTCVRLPKPSK